MKKLLFFISILLFFTSNSFGQVLKGSGVRTTNFVETDTNRASLYHSTPTGIVPSSPVNGDWYYDLTSGFRFYQDGAWGSIGADSNFVTVTAEKATVDTLEFTTSNYMIDAPQNNIFNWDIGNSWYEPYTSQTPGAFYTGVVNPASIDRLNYDGYLYATSFQNNISSGNATLFSSGTGNAVYGVTNTGTSGYFKKTSTSASSNPTILIERTSPAGSFDMTGNIISIIDDPITTGTISGKLLTATIDLTERINFQPRVTSSLLNTAYFFDTHNDMVEGTIFDVRNQGTSLFKVQKDTFHIIPPTTILDTLYAKAIKWQNGTGIVDGNDTTGKFTEDTAEVKVLIVGEGAVKDTSVGFIDPQTDIETIEFNKLQFALSSQSYSPNMIYWDTSKQALTGYNDIEGFSHNYGYEDVRRVYNNTGATISNERFVRRTGTHVNDGRVATIALAGISSPDSINVWGITTVDIPINSYGIITVFGDVGGANNQTLSEDRFYCGFAGVPIDTSPPPPYYSICGGEVLYSDNDSGIYSVNLESATLDPSPLFSTDTSELNEVVSIITQDVYEYLPLGNCNIDENLGFTIVVDSVQIDVAGYYQIVLSSSFQGNPTSETWNYGIFINNEEEHKKTRTTASNAAGDINVPLSRQLELDDWISFRIKNLSGTGDPTIVDMAVQILFLHE
jgi:hypothetical protein